MRKSQSRESRTRDCLTTEVRAMNCNKTAVFDQIFSCAALALLSVLFSTAICAQNRALPLNFNKFVAASNESDAAGLKRPRVVTTTTGKTETAKIISESSASALSAAALVSQIERQAFNVLNLKRAEHGLPPLIWSEDMAKVARAHSQEMAQFKFFSHTGRNGSMVDDRADSLGFKKWKAIGENIAYNRGYENPAEFACERWMLSTSHRENILNSRWREAGIGVAITSDGTYYFTEVFIVR